jgi:hypothetical protein
MPEPSVPVWNRSRSPDRGRGQNLGTRPDGLIPLMQPGANVVRRECLPATFGTNDDHTGCRDTRQTCEAE